MSLVSVSVVCRHLNCITFSNDLLHILSYIVALLLILRLYHIIFTSRQICLVACTRSKFYHNKVETHYFCGIWIFNIVSKYAHHFTLI